MGLWERGGQSGMTERQEIEAQRKRADFITDLLLGSYDQMPSLIHGAYICDEAMEIFRRHNEKWGDGHTPLEQPQPDQH